MRFSWTQAAAGALFLALLGGMIVLPGRLLAPDHRVQLSLGLSQQPHGGSVQAVPPLERLKPVKVVLRHPAVPGRKPVATHRDSKTGSSNTGGANQLAAVIVRTHRAPVRRAVPTFRPVVHPHAVAVQSAPKAP